MAHSTHSHLYRVTYADCTVGNHIYYSRYLDILEAARGEFFRHLGRTFHDWQGEDTIFPVMESHLRYRRPARYDEIIRVETWIAELTRIRLGFDYRILNQSNEAILSGETRHVCTTLADKPKRIPSDLAKLLAPFISPVTAPETPA